MKTLLELVQDIKADLEQSNDLRLQAAINLAKAHDLVDKKDPEANGMKWKAFATKHFELSWSEVKKLVKIGASDVPEKAMADHRAKTRKSVAKSRESNHKNGSDVGAQAGPGAAWGGGNPKSNGENGGPEPGTVEQQRDNIIHVYEAQSGDARKSFRQWLADQDDNDALPHDLPITREAMSRSPSGR